MITGIVNAYLEATIRVCISGPGGQHPDLEAVVDTGFTGSLTLPPTLIAGLGLAWRSRGSAILGNGNVDYFDIHTATLTWDGATRNILVEAADTDPLVGMGLLAGHDLRIQAVVGGKVTIEALP